MSKHIRAFLAIVGIAALMISLVAVVPKTSKAANLTGGTYTYLINGEEVTFTFDPVVRKDGLLLPVEVYQRFGIMLDGANSNEITLSKDTVSIQLTLGVAAMKMDGVVKTTSTAPVRLNGRLFVPTEPLREFGVDFTQDNTYVILRNFTDTMPEAKQVEQSQWNITFNTHTFAGNLKMDSGAYVNSQFTLLTPDLVNATNIGFSYGTRARLNGLLKTNTLILVSLSNLSSKSGAIVTTGTSLVDDQRNQYDVANVLDIGSGLVTNRLAPGANRTGVLVFPKVPSSINTLSLFYDNNGAVIGTFPLIK